MSCKEPQLWYCFQTLRKKEHHAAQQIRQRVGVDVLCPRIRYQRISKKGIGKYAEALFPNYLFVCCNLELHLRHVLAMSGISRAVRYGDRIAEVPEVLVSSLMALFPAEIRDVTVPALEPGQEVTLTEGPFRNLKVIVESYVPAKNRIRVLLEFLGRDMTIEVSPQHVAVADTNTRPVFDLSLPDQSVANHE
jgi:transcriptional antiterminator RfaH